ncbi:MAG: hypothetical protein Q8Q14_06875 [Gemmatimonadales bacterium]|nr:hypothetical protein [Gemmatimonadales bacterium]
MNPLIAVALLQAARPCDRAAAAAAAAAGWDAYRANTMAVATMRFAAADSACPAFPEAQAGLGFVRLRAGDPTSAERHFRAALRGDSSSGDAWYGWGLAQDRRGRRAQAVKAWRRALAVSPDYGDALDALLAAGVDSGLPGSGPVARPAGAAVAARIAGERFEVLTGAAWRSLYVKGVNLGVALPGRFPSEFPLDDSTYGRWLRLIVEANANVVRVYTILPPAFYRALRAWNDGHPERPLWLVQGVWTELPPRGDFDDAKWKGAFRAEMRRVVDLIHGRARIGARRGHAWGRYDTDVSDRVLAYVIGREWEPFAIGAYNRLRSLRRPGRPDPTRYAGRFLAVERGTPADVWMAEQCDYMLAYEWDTWHAARPIAYTNWPTLDPLRHPTEPTLAEEQQLRRTLRLAPNVRHKEYDNDGETLDPMVVRVTAENRAGYFAAYHAYPYYPDFIGLDSAYAGARSPLGPSRYYGYLTSLRRHHAGRALLIAEYGVPSSRGVAHLDADGRHHGGHDEAAMAAHDVRLTREIREAGLAGGILFAWLDEWFKHNWVVIDLELPPERNHLWHNVMDAEQNYGLLGISAGPADRPEPGGAAAAWEALPVVAESGGVRLHAGADPAYLYLALAGAPVDSLRWVLGIDTHRADRGQFQLDDGDRSPFGVEFAVLLGDSGKGEVVVTPSYNPYLGPRPGMRPTDLDKFYNMDATIDARLFDGQFDSLFVATNRFRVSRSGRTFPARGVNRGRLRYGPASASSLADWYVDRVAGLVEVRLAWSLLNVTDPSSRTVLARVRDPGPFRTVIADGLRFLVRGVRPDGAVGPRLTSASAFAWPTWNTPVWHERLKPAYYAMQALWGSW